MSDLHPRLNAFRADLADIGLKGRVEAPRFTAPRAQQVVVAVADMRRVPRPDSAIDTQLLFGELVDVFDDAEGWCWVQARNDKYVGYVSDAALSARISAPTHVICAPRTFVYPGPDMKFPAETALSIGSQIAVTGEAETRGTRYLLLSSGGAVVESHVAPARELFTDPAALAERLLETPYLWGGKSGYGIDCSGLVQLTHALCGIHLQRDTAMQSETAGKIIHPGRDGVELRRGDLVFWRGHVAMMLDPKTIIHASGHSMSVAREGFAEAVERIGYMYGAPTGYRRIDPSTAYPD